MRTLPEQIKRLRISKNMSQGALAQKAGIAQPQISKFETSLPPFRMSTLERIAEALDCTIVISLLPKEISDSDSDSSESSVSTQDNAAGSETV